MPLTDVSVRKAKGRATPYKLTDGGGLYLLVHSGDARYWRMDYRWGGKRRTLAFGVYPSVSLAEAREKRNQAKKLLASGADPSARRKLERLAAKTVAHNTFRLISEEWIGKLAREGRACATLGKIKWLLELAYPEIGERPMATITPPELLAALRKVEGRGHYETARRLRSTCGQVFRYAIATGRAERDPSTDLRGALTAPKAKHRAAVTDPKAIGAILRAIEGYNGQPITLAALRLAPLLFVRPGELRRAEWSEFDLEGAEWRIPAAKMKMRLPHRVSLSRQAVAILRDLHRITGHGQYLFPSIRTTRRPISENTLNAALRRTRLQQRRGHDAWIPIDGRRQAERDGTMERRRDRTAIGASRSQQCTTRIHACGRILDRTLRDDAGLGRSIGSVARRREGYLGRFGRRTRTIGPA